MSPRTIVHWNSTEGAKHWQPTTLDKLNKDEKFFEDVLVSSPELLGLESRRTGIRGPFSVFQQLGLETPSGRSIYPDIVILAASGHVIVVEVKRHVNPELRDRAVIAQIIDYASSFAALTEQQAAQLFGSGTEATWTELIETLFPDDPASDELSSMLLGRIQNGELNLVIACDKIPTGLPDVVSGITSQSTVGFDLDLVEVVPFVRDASETADIMFVPSTRLATEIVSRTAVTVTYRQGDEQPSTSVQTTSLEDIEENVRKTTRIPNPDARVWSPSEVEEEFQRDGNRALLDLLRFVKEHSAAGPYLAPGKTLNPVFGFYVTGKLNSSGSVAQRMVFNCTLGWGGIYMYLNFVRDIVSEETYAEFLRRLKSVFGDEVNTDQKETGVSGEALGRHMQEFQEVMLWLKEQAESRVSA